MKVKDYFKVSFSKPAADETISAIIQRKANLKQDLEACYSRLESIELCNSSSKSADAIILSSYLLQDALSVVLKYYNKDKSTAISDSVKKIEDLEIAALFEKHMLIENGSHKDESEKAEKLENSLSEIVYKIEKFIFKKHGNEFENPIDDFKKRLTIQVAFLVIVLGVVFNAGFKEYRKNKQIQADEIRIFYTNTERPIPTEKQSIASKVIPSKEWQTINFVLPEPSDIKDVKIEPLHQVFARVQFKEIKYLGAGKNVLKQKEFKLNKLGFIDNDELKLICCMEDFKPGRLIPEKNFELETTGSMPSLIIKLESEEKVSEIQFTYRYIKNKEQFPLE